LAIWYNGNATGPPNCCDRDESKNCGCLHSEENAVIHCDATRETKKYFYVTHSPCIACAKRIINLGNVVRVTYLEDYKGGESLALLNSVGIGTVKANLDF